VHYKGNRETTYDLSVTRALADVLSLAAGHDNGLIYGAVGDILHGHVGVLPDGLVVVGVRAAPAAVAGGDAGA
jgi:hypothetical protein